MKNSALKLVFYPLILVAIVAGLLPFLVASTSEDFSYVSVIFDIALLGFSIVALYFLLKAVEATRGSVLGKVLINAFVGLVFLTFAHTLETNMFLFGVEADLNEIIHRIVILATILPFLNGFYLAYKEFKN